MQLRLELLSACNDSSVAEYLELRDTDMDLRSAVLLDYYVGAMWWSREQSYSAEQTSALFTIIDTLFHNLGIHSPLFLFISLLIVAFTMLELCTYCRYFRKMQIFVISVEGHLKWKDKSGRLEAIPPVGVEGKAPGGSLGLCP